MLLLGLIFTFFRIHALSMATVKAEHRGQREQAVKSLNDLAKEAGVALIRTRPNVKGLLSLSLPLPWRGPRRQVH